LIYRLVVKEVAVNGLEETGNIVDVDSLYKLALNIQIKAFVGKPVVEAAIIIGVRIALDRICGLSVAICWLSILS
jgi:hypothetical protein